MKKIIFAFVLLLIGISAQAQTDSTIAPKDSAIAPTQRFVVVSVAEENDTSTVTRDGAAVQVTATLCVVTCMPTDGVSPPIKVYFSGAGIAQTLSAVLIGKPMSVVPFLPKQ